MKKNGKMKLNSIMKKLIAVACNYSGVLDLSNKFSNKNKIIILLYHQAKQDKFKHQMLYLLQNNYKIISIDEAVKRIKTDKINGNELVITFDDGYKNNYAEVYPVMKSFHFPATIFLTSSLIGEKKYAWWDAIEIFLNQYKKKHFRIEINKKQYSFSTSNNHQKNRSADLLRKILKRSDDEVREKILHSILRGIKNGRISRDKNYSFMSWEDARKMLGLISFGAHSVTHPILTNCKTEKMRSEIVNSKKDIEKKLKIKVSGFCYPNGDFNENVKSMVKKAGFEYACSTKLAHCSSHENLYALPRVPIDINDDILVFKLKLSPIWLVIK